MNLSIDKQPINAHISKQTFSYGLSPETQLLFVGCHHLSFLSTDSHIQQCSSSDGDVEILLAHHIPWKFKLEVICFLLWVMSPELQSNDQVRSLYITTKRAAALFGAVNRHLRWPLCCNSNSTSDAHYHYGEERSPEAGK